MNSCLNKVKLCPRKVDAVTRAVPLSKFYEIHTFHGKMVGLDLGTEFERLPKTVKALFF